MTQPSNPLLIRIRLPGETFRLPSGGVFYKNGELADDVTNGEVLVYPMTTIDEITMKTPDKLLNGTAFVDVFHTCVPQVLKPMELFAKDVDFLMVCLRKLSYGPSFELPWNHQCSKDAKEHTYSIPLDPFINNARALDPTTATKMHSLKLENGQEVKLQPAKIMDVIKMYQNMDFENVDTNKLHDQIIHTIASLVHSVDGISDREMIVEWAKKIPVKWVKMINESIEKVSNWGPNFEITLKCKDCGGEFTAQVPLNPVAFFS